jgi:Uncharacterized conserved protein
MSFFFVKRLVGGLIQPVPIVLILLLLAFLLLIRAGALRRLLGMVCLGLALALFAAVAFPYPVRSVARELEGNYRPVLDPDDVPYEPGYIVVLGNGVDHPGDAGLPGLTRLNHSARARLVEGVRLARLFPEAKLITCGFGRGLENCADAMRDAAIELGVDPTRIERVDKARDTEEEAAMACAIIRDSAVVLVTTAVHMERAVSLFGDCGATIIPSPCDFIAPQSDGSFREVTRYRWRPRGSNIVNNEKTWHELLGLAYLWYRGDSGEDE